VTNGERDSFWEVIHGLQRSWKAANAESKLAATAFDPTPPPFPTFLAFLSRTGTRLVNGSDVPYVQLSIGNLASIPNFSPTCAAGAAPLASAVHLADATINATIFYNLTAPVAFPYGDGVVNVSAGAIKWNIDAAGWPFCGSTHQLMLELSIFTSQTSTEDDEPVLFDDAGEHAALLTACMELCFYQGKERACLHATR